MKQHPLTGYIQQLASLMGLANWRVRIQGGTTDPDAYAQTIPWERRYQAEITLKQDWRPESQEDLREVLVHELLHLHFWATEQAFKSVETLMERPAHAAVLDRYQTAQEQTIHQIARFWAPKLPLPPPIKE